MRNSFNNNIMMLEGATPRCAAATVPTTRRAAEEGCSARRTASPAVRLEVRPHIVAHHASYTAANVAVPPTPPPFSRRTPPLTPTPSPRSPSKYHQIPLPASTLTCREARCVAPGAD